MVFDSVLQAIDSRILEAIGVSDVKAFGLCEYVLDGKELSIIDFEGNSVIQDNNAITYYHRIESIKETDLTDSGFGRDLELGREYLIRTGVFYDRQRTGLKGHNIYEGIAAAIIGPQALTVPGLRVASVKLGQAVSDPFNAFNGEFRGLAEYPAGQRSFIVFSWIVSLRYLRNCEPKCD